MAHEVVLSDEGSISGSSSYRIDMSRGAFFGRLTEHRGSQGPYPTCFAYSVDRRLNPLPSLQQPQFMDTADGLFLETSSTGDAEGWLLRLDYASSKTSRMQGRQKQRLEMVKDALIKVLPGDVSEIRFDASSGFRPTPKAEFKTPYGWVPLRQLGYGYRAMIAWVVDLAARMVECYPDSRDPLAGPAVVLVDEIDLHLHPKWQRKVIGYLTDRFRNTQFIVTSHSPLTVQSAANANIVVLRHEGDHVVIKNDPETLRGWRVDQVLTSELFGLETARPPDMEELLRRRKEILSKPRLTKADQKVLEEINDQIGPIAPGESFDEAKKTMDLIERSIELVKKYQGTKT
jgi:predicted ATP-binding protein involved in virulence